MEEFNNKINDLYNRSLDKNIITYTGFLTPAEKQYIIKNFPYCTLYFSGGIEQAERTRAFFLPDYLKEIRVEEYIVAFCARFSFKELTHRDFLGAILSLGIKRECVGDIYIFEKEAYFFVVKEMEEYIKLNLTKVGKIGVKISKVPFDKVKIPIIKFEEVIFTVKSIRLDSILAGIFNKSREKISVKIKDGEVFLNYLICDNASNIIKEGDIVSLKGYGKAIIKEIGGKSRSGKIFVKVHKLV